MHRYLDRARVVTSQGDFQSARCRHFEGAANQANGLIWISPLGEQPQHDAFGTSSDDEPKTFSTAEIARLTQSHEAHAPARPSSNIERALERLRDCRRPENRHRGEERKQE